MAIPPVKTSTNVELNNSTGTNATGANTTLKAHASLNAAPGAPNKNSEAFQQVNQQLNKNSPNTPNQNNQAHGNSEGNHGNSAHASLQGSVNIAPRGNGNHNGNQGGNGNHYGHQNRGSSDAPQNNVNQASDGGNHGNGHAYGHNKSGGNPNSPLNIDINFSTGNRHGNSHHPGNSHQANGNNNQTIINNQTTTNGNQTTPGGNHGHGHQNNSAPPQSQSNSLNLNLNLSLDRSNNGNHNGIVRSVLNNVLRQNDIYLNQNVIRHFVSENVAKTTHDNGNHYGSRQNVSIPPAVTQIVQTIKSQILTVLNNPAMNFNHGHVRVTIQNSPELASLIQTSKNVLHSNFGAKQFVNLNLNARMHIVSEMILHNLHNLPTSPQQILRNQSSKQIFNGLLVALGFAVSADKFSSLRNIFDARKYPLPFNVPPVVIRNLGHAVKALMTEARLAETPQDLEAAVQKFVRALSGKNNADALASVVRLAEYYGARTGADAKLPATDEIASLVKYLILAGDKTLQSIADAFDAAEGELLLPKNAANLAENLADATDIDRDLGRIWASGDNDAAESSLRRQLDINPFFLHDRAASAFDNPSDAARAQEEFTNRYQHEIEQWLQSGNHRFVKDLELDKPVGILVERGTSGYFTADRARVVLVRDGSVQGWHFLKSFLVK